VRLNWLENAYSHPLFFQLAILTHKVGHTDLVLVYNENSLVGQCSVHARVQVSVCSGYELFHPDTQHGSLVGQCSVHARVQVSVCSGYELFHPDTQHTSTHTDSI